MDVLKKRADELVYLLFYTGCVYRIALIFCRKKFLKNSKIIVDLVPKGDYIIYNKRETQGHTSAQERGTQ